MLRATPKARARAAWLKRFNGHPPLGVNATRAIAVKTVYRSAWFQWAPTLGGECYWFSERLQRVDDVQFQWAPTLGGECYQTPKWWFSPTTSWFQWAPTLGGECYTLECPIRWTHPLWFQWAPTLGGECYSAAGKLSSHAGSYVSMGTHPWG